MEEGGVPLTLGLKKSDPCETPGCQFGDKNCWVAGSKCATMGSVYCITCNSCKQVLDPEIKEVPAIPGGVKSAHYIGMSATSLTIDINLIENNILPAINQMLWSSMILNVTEA